MKNFFMKLKTVVFVTLAVFSALNLDAKVRLPKLVSDRMVLQRDCELNIWGWADPAEHVTVNFRGNDYYTQADAEGNWSVALPAQTPGGPFIMQVNEIIIRDVLVGDVYLASGQSNQETPINRLVEKFPEINVSNNHMIRHYKVPTQNTAEALQEEIAGDQVWHSATASEVMNWTALAYFFAQEAYAKTGVPVGMLVSSLGGSAIQSWISQEHLKDFPNLLIDTEALAARDEMRRDKGAGVWNTAEYNDAAWLSMNVPGTWRENGINVRGTVWYRKTIEVPAEMVGRYATLYMGTLTDSDEIFVNGTFVGSTSYQYPPRKYNVPAGVLKEGKNVIAVKLTSMGGNGEFVADKHYKLVGAGHEIDLRGPWKYNTGSDMSASREIEGRLRNLRNAGSGLYNGMIHPIRNYKVCAAIWYQGESNAGDPRYYDYLKSLVENWRELWGFEMPFLFVQLPNHMKKHANPSESGWAVIREAQLKAALTIPSSSLATTYDIGEWNDIHPLDKKSLAQRLFLGARRLVLKENIQDMGPLYKSMTVKDGKAIIEFTNVGKGLAIAEPKESSIPESATSNLNGLAGKSGAGQGAPEVGKGKLRHFAIAGEDGVFVWADAVIKGKTVVVSSPLVPNPVAVRYAWADNPDEGNLMNKEGLLASPFRTDMK